MRTPTSRGLVAAAVIVLTLRVTACGDRARRRRPRDVPTTGIRPHGRRHAGQSGHLAAHRRGDLRRAPRRRGELHAGPRDHRGDAEPARPPTWRRRAPTTTWTPTNKPASGSISALRPFDMAGRIGNPGYEILVAVLKPTPRASSTPRPRWTSVGSRCLRPSHRQRSAIADTGNQVLRVVVPKETPPRVNRSTPSSRPVVAHRLTLGIGAADHARAARVPSSGARRDLHLPHPRGPAHGGRLAAPPRPRGGGGARARGDRLGRRAP